VLLADNGGLSDLVGLGGEVVGRRNVPDILEKAHKLLRDNFENCAGA
jgi:hypothetical protein